MNSFTSTAAMLRDDPAVEVGAINCERAENRKICADWLAVDSYPSLYLLNRYLLLPAPTCSYLLLPDSYPSLYLLDRRHHALAKYPKDADKSAERVHTWALETAREWRHLFQTSDVLELHESDFTVRRNTSHPPTPPCVSVPCRDRLRTPSPRLASSPHASPPSYTRVAEAAVVGVARAVRGRGGREACVGGALHRWHRMRAMSIRLHQRHAPLRLRAWAPCRCRLRRLRDSFGAAALRATRAAPTAARAGVARLASRGQGSIASWRRAL